MPFPRLHGHEARAPAQDLLRSSSTGHASKPPAPPASHSSSGPHHSLPPPPNYPDSQSRHMVYDNWYSVPLNPTGYPPNSHLPPPPTLISQQAPHEPHGGLPAKKNTRASHACDQCRQMKAKCEETKPCKPCRDKGVECKSWDAVPKARYSGWHHCNAKHPEIRMEANFPRSGVNSVYVKPYFTEQHLQSRQESPYVINGGPVEIPYSDASRDVTLDSEERSPLGRVARHEVEAEPGLSAPPSETVIPIHHTSFAGGFLEWPSIRDLIKPYIGHEGIRHIREYPISHEQNRGPLFVHERGEGSRQPRHTREAMNHGNLNMAKNSFDMSSPSPAAGFGHVGGLSPPKMMEYRGGVPGPHGNPDFTEIKVWSYVESFKEHILSMHPIVQPADLDYWVRHFLDNLPTAHPRSTKQPAAKATFAIPTNTLKSSNETTGSKRKRSPGTNGSEGPPTPASVKAGQPSRSIHSALVLTILALGKVCQHRDRVPDIFQPNSETGSQGSPVVGNGVSQSPSQGSPPGYSFHSNSSAQPSPIDQQEPNGQSRRPSIHGSAGCRSAGYNLKKDYEVIPGLKYFAYATEILGNLAGSYNDMKDVYANIFASLYFGQLNRPLEGFAFIHKASHKLMVIMRPSLDKLRNVKKCSVFVQEPKYNQLALAFWTCLQLESDPIGELPLPPSGLLLYEDDMPHPNMSLLKGFDQRVLDSYLGQLYLRTHLNSIHRIFYAAEDPNNPRQDKFQNVKLAADAVSQMHWVAPSFAFKEEDPPAPDILAARLRERYWGAQAITYRPFVKQILQFSHSVANHPQRPNPPTWSEFRDDIIAPSFNTGAKSLSEIDSGVVELAGKGIKALIENTRAFHNLGELRPIITNVFVTAHAQWGNLLVLYASYKDPILRRFVDESTLRTLFYKTIQFLQQSATSTSSLRIDMRILESLQQGLSIVPNLPIASSLSSHTNIHTLEKGMTEVLPLHHTSCDPSTMVHCGIRAAHTSETHNIRGHYQWIKEMGRRHLIEEPTNPSSGRQFRVRWVYWREQKK